MNFLVRPISIVLLAVVFLFGLFSFATQESRSVQLDYAVSHIFSLLGLLLVLASISKRDDARKS